MGRFDAGSQGPAPGPAAAVYEEACVEGFDGSVLELAFPDELSIYVKLAQDSRHADPLREAIASRFGVNPQIECRIDDGSSGDTSPPEEESLRQEAEQETRPGDHGLAGTTNEQRGGTGAEAQGHVSGGTEGDDIIRDQREVFEMARERFGPGDPNGGARDHG